MPDNVSIEPNDVPDEAVDNARSGTYFIVITHNHAVDLELAARILARGDFAFFGMIGSYMKKKQFEHRTGSRRAASIPCRSSGWCAPSASMESSIKRPK